MSRLTTIRTITFLQDKVVWCFWWWCSLLWIWFWSASIFIHDFPLNVYLPLAINAKYMEYCLFSTFSLLSSSCMRMHVKSSKDCTFFLAARLVIKIWYFDNIPFYVTVTKSPFYVTVTKSLLDSLMNIFSYITMSIHC